MKKALWISAVLCFLLVRFADAATPQVAASYYHTLGLKSNGTVVATGSNASGELNVSSWSNIIQVACGSYDPNTNAGHSVGLKSDGTVVATGNNYYGQCNVGSWSNIVQIAAGSYHTVGLKSDGTVVAVGRDNDSVVGYVNACNVGSWSNIVEIAASGDNTFGVKADGTVVGVGNNYYGQLNVGSWTNIAHVTSGASHTMGLYPDGTVTCITGGTHGQCSFTSTWNNIIQISAGHCITLGLKADGTVLTVGSCGPDTSTWSNIAQVAGGYFYAVGLRKDCTVIAAGANDQGQCNTNSWNLCTTAITLSDFRAIPGNKEITLVWSTESEIDNAGFNLYRSESEDGKYTKINSSLIPAKGTSIQGASYEFIDKDVKNRKTYYYKLEDIDLNGTSTMHGPVSATPRLIFGVGK